MKNQTRFVLAAASTFAASLALGALAMSSLTAPETTLPAPEHEGASASWISDAETVAEQVMEADLVVRVQTLQQAEPRHLWHPTPAGAKPGTFAFTDTQVEVLEVYRGNAEIGDRLWVMQTGGDLVTREGKIARLEIAEDPIYRLGDEMVLFLVDISGDSVHAADRELFRTINPASRYHVEGGLVDQVPFGRHHKARSLDLASLEAQIDAAVAQREALEAVR